MTTTAFTLAGGGTKGAFEVGAIDHLVRHRGLAPSVITAASAGSIIGTVLAQGRTPDEFAALAEQLRADLLAMSDVDMVFGRQPWLTDLADTPFGAQVEALIARRPALPASADPTVAAALDVATADRSHHRHRGLHALGAVVTHAGALHHASRDLPGHATSILTLDPLGQALRGGTDSGIAPIDPQLVARPGLELRLAVTALRSGVTRYVTGTGTVVEADARTPCTTHPAPVDLVEAVLTSSSAPIAFPPRQWDDEPYNDGGIAQNVPVDAAAALGVDQVVAVLAMPLHVEDPTDFVTSSLLTVNLRTSMIMFLAQQRASLATPRADGVAVRAVVPTVDVVGAFEVNPGLLRIDMDYGWLRAEETMADLDDGDRAAAMAATDTAITARDHAWHLEQAAWDGGLEGAERQAVLDAARRCKEAVGEAVARRAALGLTTPPGADAWATGWESHEGTAPDDLPDHP
ncbi:MAG: patatin-like phospholipase family protein [Acidimicrobiia bacterium]|nr:patatin-like phospholipase family protein [Acidimicrobiia bacterium]